MYKSVDKNTFSTLRNNTRQTTQQDDNQTRSDNREPRRRRTFGQNLNWHLNSYIWISLLVFIFPWRLGVPLKKVHVRVYNPKAFRHNDCVSSTDFEKWMKMKCFQPDFLFYRVKFLSAGVIFLSFFFYITLCGAVLFVWHLKVRWL